MLITIPDYTRPLSIPVVLSETLKDLRDSGGDLSRVKVMVGLGLHRPLTQDEKQPILDVMRAHGLNPLQMLENNPHAQDLICVSEDPPAYFSPHVVNAPEILTIGVVEPHQYAGFSGGAKGVVIGCGAARTIQHLHSLSMLARPGVGVGITEGNPFLQTLWEIAGHLPPIRGKFWVPEASGKGRWFEGPAKEAHHNACEYAKTVHFQEVEPQDWLLLKVPPSKASNFYQASRAATYAALVARPAIKPGGWILVEASCPEGFGAGEGERAAADRARLGVDELLRQLRSPSPPQTSGGAQRAYVLALALERAKIGLVGAPPIPELALLGIAQFDSLEGLCEGSGLVVDSPFHRVPVCTSGLTG